MMAPPNSRPKLKIHMIGCEKEVSERSEASEPEGYIHY